MREITKQPATMEDLACGVGKIMQTRGTSDFILGKVALHYGVETLTQLAELDTTAFNLARLFQDGSFTDYIYVAATVEEGVASVGGGTWVELLSTKDVAQDQQLLQLNMITVVPNLLEANSAWNVASTSSPLPSATPTSYSIGQQLGFERVADTAMTGVTVVDGLFSATSGTYLALYGDSNIQSRVMGGVLLADGTVSTVGVEVQWGTTRLRMEVRVDTALAPPHLCPVLVYSTDISKATCKTPALEDSIQAAYPALLKARTWVSYSSSERAVDTVYTNTDLTERCVSIKFSDFDPGDDELLIIGEVDGQPMAIQQLSNETTAHAVGLGFQVPAGSTYRLEVILGSVSRTPTDIWREFSLGTS